MVLSHQPAGCLIVKNNFFYFAYPDSIKEVHMKKEILCATSNIRGSCSYPKLRGTVQFKQIGSNVLVTAEIFNLPCEEQTKPNIFAFHIHEGCCCTGTNEDPFADAKGHYNPNNTKHPFHAGDLPPIFGNHGYAYMSVLTDRFTVKEIVGRVIIIHRNLDDFTSQPSGNAGEKIACGKIYC